MAADTLRFGLAGYGPWGAMHAAAIAHTPGARLTAIAERAAERRAAARQAWGDVAIVDDWATLVMRDDVDLVDVVLPSPLHFEVARAAIEAGKHVLIETPLVEHFRQADELIARACEHEVMLSVGHQRRVAPLWNRLQQLVAQGVIGRPQRVAWEISCSANADHELLHAFDLARWYLAGVGEPKSVCVRELEFGSRYLAVVDLAGDACLTCEPTPSDGRAQILCRVEGEQDAIRALWIAGDPPCADLRYGVPERTELVEPTTESVNLARHLAAVAHATLAGQSPPAGGADGRTAVRMLQAARVSLRLGRAVRISEVA